MTAVEVTGATKHYGEVLAVDGVSFTVAQGQCLSLLGPSGCGKTTTLRLIAGFETLDAGSIRINGQDMAGRRPYERNIGLVFQDYALFPHMTVAQNIAYGMRRRGVDAHEIPQRISELLGLVKLSGFEGRRVTQLSGGEQQRVALARALATRPEVLLLDEPLSNLDAKLREHVREELRDILQLTKITTIIVTHDQQEAMSLSNVIVVMRQGRVMQKGTPADIYARASSRFVADFIGSMNWFVGERRGVAGDLAEYAVAAGVQLRAPALEGGSGPVHLGVRPERIELLNPAQPAPDSDGNLLQGVVARTMFMGGDIHLTVQVEPGLKLLVVSKNGRSPPPALGTRVTLSVNPQDCIVLPADNSAAGSGG